MSVASQDPESKTVAIIGGGLSGSLLALKLSAAMPGWTVAIIERDARLGRGLAYGACDPGHLLNVPVARMEVGLRPSFEDWLRPLTGELSDALEESGGQLAEAFVPRELFGQYIEHHAALAIGSRAKGGLHRIRGEAVSVRIQPRGVLLDDGREVRADIVVLATGQPPAGMPVDCAPSRHVVRDPWSPHALQGIPASRSVLLLGSGLTAMDAILSLQRAGHLGQIHVVSRHGLLPESHRGGGAWGRVLEPGVSPKDALRIVRAHVAAAREQEIPWQRVFDAIRPSVASVWRAWTIGQRAQFLRHLRARWDVCRHRMARRISRKIAELVAGGKVTVLAGRLLALDENKDNVVAVVRPRGGKPILLEADFVINCTGPRTDIRHSQQPVLRALLKQGLISSDRLGLGLDSEDCAVRGRDGTLSDWLFAVGPPTRPAFWEIIAVPEINAQVDRLVDRFKAGSSAVFPHLASTFLDMGAGI